MGVVSRLLSSGGVLSFDTSVDRAAEHLRGHGPADRVMYALSEAANHSILWHSINIADAMTGDEQRRHVALRRSAILAVEQALVNGVVKLLFRRDRPAPVADSPHRLRKPRTSSFPSGHASAGACAATLLSEDLGMAPLWWTTAAMVSWSRIHVGVHHGSDVLGGLVIGRLLALSAGKLWPPLSQTAPTRQTIAR